MKATEQKHNYGTILLLLLCAIFAALILMVLLLGAKSYKTVAAMDSEAFGKRTCDQYIAAKIRHFDSSANVYTGSFSSGSPEVSTLFLAQNIEGEKYVTQIYWYDGYVYELFSAADSGLRPEDGNKIMKSNGLGFEQKDNFITIKSDNTDGSRSELSVYVRSGGGGQ